MIGIGIRRGAAPEELLKTGEKEVFCVLEGEYSAGDVIRVFSDSYPVMARVRLDETLGEAVVYLTGELVYEVPDENGRLRLSPLAFTGKLHYLHAAVLSENEKGNYADLACNPYDMHDAEHCFPHLTANAETRHETVFYAMNVNNDIIANDSHGDWPYASWGIDGWKEAAITIHFGRPVKVDVLSIYLRADFPHDNWWPQLTVEFSGGEEIILHPEKTGVSQDFKIERTVTTITLKDLKISDEPSLWPALSALKAWGRYE